MSVTSFTSGGVMRQGYLALPLSGQGKGVLVLHAWWGLTDFFKTICNRLAAQGFVAFAPDLHHGATATTIEEASRLLEIRDIAAVQATAESALQYLQSHSAVNSERLGAVGFSMGVAFAVLLDQLYPEAFDKIVIFYGTVEDDLSASKAQFQCHFGENDDWEPLENVKQMAAPNVEIHTYPGVGHWFIEDDKPDHFVIEAANMAWNRTLDFLGKG